MSVNKTKYLELIDYCKVHEIELVAVSKIKPVEDILSLYNLGQRDFGENYVQEMTEKHAALPKDIRWHFIGHLQRNKVKFIAPFVHLIQGVDSLKLLKEINKQGEKINRKINCLLQIFIATEETKFGLDEEELQAVMEDYHSGGMAFVEIRGLMGMASFSDDLELVGAEFNKLRALFSKWKDDEAGFTLLSMGMTGDYKLAVENGSNMLRIGSLIFGARE